MNWFFSTLPRHILECFKGRMFIWHLIAIILTIAVVVSGFDWQYFLCTRSPSLLFWLFPAVPIGGFVPVALPLAVFLLSAITRNAQVRMPAWAISQAEIIGGIIAAGYKALTGRAHPAYERRDGPQPSLSIRFAARRGVLGLALISHDHCLCHGRHRVHIVSEEAVGRIRGVHLRWLRWPWRVHDYSLVLGLCGRGDHWNGGRRGRWKRLSAEAQRTCRRQCERTARSQLTVTVPEKDIPS